MNAVEIMFTGSSTGAVAAADETKTSIEGVGTTAKTSSSKAMSSFSSLGSTMKAVAGTFAALGAVHLFEGAISSAEQLVKATDSLSTALHKQGADVDALMPKYQAVAKAAAQYGIDQADAMQGLARATTLTGSAAQGMRAYQEAVVISKATGKDFNAVLTATAKGQEGVTTSLQRYGIEIPKGTAGTKQLADVMERFGGQAKANTSNMDRLRANAQNLETELGGPLLTAVNYLAGALSSLILWFESPSTQGAIDKFASGFMTKIQPIVTWFQQNWPEIKTIIVTTVQDAWAIVKDTIAAFQAGWREFGSTITTIVKNDFQTIGNVILDVVKVIRGVVQIVQGIAHGNWHEVWDGIKNVVSGALSAILDALRGLGRNAATILGKAAHLMWTALSDGFADLVKLAKAIPAKIVTAIGKLGRLLYNAGGDLIQGLINGVKHKAEALLGTLKGIVDKAKGVVKSALGIFSPSKVFYGYGVNLMEGLAGGISDASGLPVASLGSVSSLTPSLSSSALGSGAGAASAGAAGYPTTTLSGVHYHNCTINVTSLSRTARGLAKELGDMVASAPRSPKLYVTAR